MPPNPPLYDLFHLADSALPAGGYAFSNGLEAALHHGLVANDLEAYLETVLFSVAEGELPFIHSCFIGEETQIATMLWFYDAMLTAPAQIRASLTLGRTWLRLLHILYPDREIDHFKNWLDQNKLPPHYTVVYGTTLKKVGFEKSDVNQVYMYQTLRDQLSAAVRLGLLGPLEATSLQKRLYTTCEKAIGNAADRPYDRAIKNAPQLDIAQAAHEHLYTRLFQS
ncbi:MAG: hypothetical protein O7G87_03745 [bacterium]|nr:hypothetical protein [bacterium]